MRRVCTAVVQRAAHVQQQRHGERRQKRVAARERRQQHIPSVEMTCRVTIGPLNHYAVTVA